MTYPRLEAVIFDLDDTLIGEQSVDTAVLAEVCAGAGARFGFDPAGLDDEIIEQAAAELPLAGQETDRAATELSWAEALWGPFEHGDGGHLRVAWPAVHDFRRRVWGTALGRVGGSSEEAAHWCSAEFAARRSAAQPLIDGAGELLDGLRSDGLRLGLLTNGAVCVQEAKLSRCGLGPYFDEVVVSGSLPWPKPDPRAFEAAMARLGSTPGTTLMVGNSLYHDIEPARKLGLHTAWLAPADTAASSDRADAIRRLADIREVMAQVALAPRQRFDTSQS